MTMTSVIARYAPISDKPVLFLADSRSRNDGLLEVYVDKQIKKVGYDFYMHTQPVDAASAKALAADFAKSQNMSVDDVLIRQRFPKTNKAPHRLNDADLQLVQQGQPKQEAKPTNLTELAQAIQDEHTRRQGDNKATPEKPEGAVVEGKAKRPYNKRQPSARQLAALKRYQQEIAATAAKSPTIMEPAVGNVTPEQRAQAVKKLAEALAEILLGNPGAV
jgi:hypothetical protein